MNARGISRYNHFFTIRVVLSELNGESDSILYKAAFFKAGLVFPEPMRWTDAVFMSVFMSERD